MANDSNYQRLIRETLEGDQMAAEIFFSESLRREDKEGIKLAVENLDSVDFLSSSAKSIEDSMRYNIFLKVFIALNKNNVLNLRLNKLPKGLVSAEMIDSFQKIEERFFDISNGGFVEIKAEQNFEQCAAILEQNRQKNQNTNQLILESSGPVWGNLTWPMLLEKLLEKRVFDINESKHEIGSLIKYAANMVNGADAVGYIDKREDKGGEMVSTSDFDFLFVDGKVEFQIGSTGKQLRRDITVFYKKPDGDIGEIRPDMSQEEMVKFMGKPNNYGKWKKSDLLREINKRGWTFCNYEEIRKSIKKPYTIPKDRGNNFGYSGMNGELAATEAVYNDRSLFICGMDDFPQAILECGEVEETDKIRLIELDPLFSAALIRQGFAFHRYPNRGVVRILKG